MRGERRKENEDGELHPTVIIMKIDDNTSECIVLISDAFETIYKVRPILCEYGNLCA